MRTDDQCALRYGFERKGFLMKVLLKQHSTGLWLKPGGRWEPTSLNAREFASSEEAILVSEESRLACLNLCFLFADSKLNFEMPAQRAF